MLTAFQIVTALKKLPLKGVLSLTMEHYKYINLRKWFVRVIAWDAVLLEWKIYLVEVYTVHA